MQDTADPSSGANRYVLPRLNHRQQGVRGLGFGANHATKALAIPAIGAAISCDAIGIRIALADCGSGNRIRMVAQGFRSVAEQGRKIRDLGRGRRVLSATPAFKDIASFDPLAANVTCSARNPHECLGASVMWLQLIVGDTPILNCVVFGQPLRTILFSRSGEQFETIWQSARGYSVPVLTRATDAGTGKKRPVLPYRKSALARIMPEGN